MADIESSIHAPAHYGPEGMDVVAFAHAHDLGRHAFNVVKHIVRADNGKKEDPAVDIGKTLWYALRMAIEKHGYSIAEKLMEQAARQLGVKADPEDPAGVEEVTVNWAATSLPDLIDATVDWLERHHYTEIQDGVRIRMIRTIKMVEMLSEAVVEVSEEYEPSPATAEITVAARRLKHPGDYVAREAETAKAQLQRSVLLLADAQLQQLLSVIRSSGMSPSRVMSIRDLFDAAAQEMMVEQGGGLVS